MKIIDMLFRRSDREKESRELRLARVRTKLALRGVDAVLREVDRVEKLVERG